MDDTILFCEICGKQLITIDEINDGICVDCRVSVKKNIQSNTFRCWACGHQLHTMDEIAQGVCHNCKLSIMKKLK